LLPIYFKGFFAAVVGVLTKNYYLLKKFASKQSFIIPRRCCWRPRQRPSMIALLSIRLLASPPMDSALCRRCWCFHQQLSPSSVGGSMLIPEKNLEACEKKEMIFNLDFIEYYRDAVGEDANEHTTINE
jgi:hypothetical protein